MTKFRVKLLAIISVIAVLFSLTACKNKHKHTYAEKFSYDTENHWRQASCEHKEEKSDFAAHTYDGNKCSVCGYVASELLVKTNAEGQKYIRTKPIHEMLQLGFSDATDPVQWVPATENNIVSYTTGNGEITVTVSAAVNNVKYTNQITIPLEESPVDVGAFFTKNAGEACMLNGIVAGFSTTSNNNEVILADKQTGQLVSVIKMGEGKLLYGGYSLPGIEIGDEIIIPVTVVNEKQSSDSANSAKIYAEYTGGIVYKSSVVSKGNQIKTAEPVVIDSQAGLEAFLSAENRESNHYKTVTLKGKLNFKLDSIYENYNFWFSEKQAVSSDDIKIDKIVPCFNNPAVFYTTGTSFSELVFGSPNHSAQKYTEPLTEEVEITAVFTGGSTGYAQFLILDRSWVSQS